jgi:hypothetical protein
VGVGLVHPTTQKRRKKLYGNMTKQAHSITKGEKPEKLAKEQSKQTPEP